MKFKALLSILVLSFCWSGVSSAQTCKSLFARSQKKISTSAAIQKFTKAFGTAKHVIGMLHLSGYSNKDVIQRAIQELEVFEKTGVHAAIVENYHGNIEQVELVLKAIQGRFPKIKIGVNILPNDYQLAFHLARKYGAQFIQLDFVSGNYSAGRSVISLDGADYQAWRNEFSEILVLGGVHPKYYNPIKGSDLNLDIQDAKSRADAIVVTGAGTGQETPMDKIVNFRNLIGSSFPLVIGAGMTAESAVDQLPISQGVIVGSYFKNGETRNLVDPAKVQQFMTVHATSAKD